MKKIIILINIVFTAVGIKAQISQRENYIQSKTSEAVQYFDDLSKPKQVVNTKVLLLEKKVETHIEIEAPVSKNKDEYNLINIK